MKRNLAKVVALLVLLACDVFLLSIVWGTGSTFEFVLNIASFALASVLTFIFARSIFFYTSDHEEFWLLVEGLTQANERIELLETNRANLFSIFSSKLRTPLQVIHGYSSMVLEGTFGRLDGPLHETMERIFRASDKMSLLAEDVTLAAQKISLPALESAGQGAVETQDRSWRKKIIALRGACFFAVALLVLQILFAASLSTIVLRSVIALFAILVSFFVLHEFMREPEAKTATANLASDFRVSQNRLKILEDERAMLHSRISVDLRDPLAEVNTGVLELQSGAIGDLPESIKEVLDKVSEAAVELSQAVVSLADILSATSNTNIAPASRNPKIS